MEGICIEDKEKRVKEKRKALDYDVGLTSLTGGRLRRKLGGESLKAVPALTKRTSKEITHQESPVIDKSDQVLELASSAIID